MVLSLSVTVASVIICDGSSDRYQLAMRLPPGLPCRTGSGYTRPVRVQAVSDIVQHDLARLETLDQSVVLPYKAELTVDDVEGLADNLP